MFNWCKWVTRIQSYRDFNAEKDLFDYSGIALLLRALFVGFFLIFPLRHTKNYVILKTQFRLQVAKTLIVR